jgi:subtilisin family serine protease
VKSATASRQSAAEPITGTSVLDLTDEQAEQLRRDVPSVTVIPDQVMPLIEPDRPRAGMPGSRTRLSASHRWQLQKVKVISNSGKRISLTGQGVTIAVLDTGIFAGPNGHEEFRRGENPNVVTESYRFDITTWQPIKQEVGKDANGHGTHVAGLIAGKTVGVAPNARLIDAAMLPTGSGRLSDFLLALEWAATRPEVQIINISAGIPGYEPTLREVSERLEAFGVLAVAATGNEGRHRTRSPGNYISVVSVGASNSKGQVSNFSSSGELVVDNHTYSVPHVIAPGEQVYSCVPGVGNLYEPWDGTSMAAPIVSGIAALILQQHPTIPLTDLKEKLYQDAVYDYDEEATRQGGGIVRFKK